MTTGPMPVHPTPGLDGAPAGPGDPRVSVVIRCYRQADFLPHAVESVLSQGYRDWEIVIVDDGSPDQTAGVAQALIAASPGRRIRLVQQANAGPPAALDADPGAAIVLADVVLFGAKAEVWKMGPFSLEALVQRNRLCCTSLYRRALWEEAGGYALNMELGYEDWDFWVGCAERGHRAVHLKQPLFFYRMHQAGETTNATAMRYHQELTAQVMLNHPRAFGPGAEETARRFLAARPLPRRKDLAREAT